LELHAFENAAGHFADDARVVHDQTGFHDALLLNTTRLSHSRLHAAAAPLRISRTQSTSSSSRSWPSSRNTPVATRASRGSRLDGLAWRSRSASGITSPTASTRRP